MKQKIFIGKPYLSHTLTHVSVNCKICLPWTKNMEPDEPGYGAEREFILHYTVPKKFGGDKYLVSERADAFVVAALPQAMLHGYDIVCEAPISERLYFQLTTMQIPAVENYMKEWRSVGIEASVSHERLESAGAAGLAFTAGIDAFYSLKLLTETKAERYRPDYLVFLKVGSTGSKGGKEEERLFQLRMKRLKKFAAQYGYQLLPVTSNLIEMLDEKNVINHTYRSASAALALQKLFSVFYYSSGLELTDFAIRHDSCGAYDLLTLQSLSTENTQFYSAGLASSRYEKVKAVSEYEPTYEYLDTCLKDREPDCGCEKCIRTRMELYAAGALEKYHKIYDLNYFRDTFGEQMDLIERKAMKGRKKPMYREIYRSFRQKGLSLEEYHPPEVRKALEEENRGRELGPDDLPWQNNRAADAAKQQI